MEHARLGRPAPQPCPTAGGADVPLHPKQEVPDQVLCKDFADAMKIISRAHGEWDRRRRDAKAVVSKCRNNTRTTGSVVLQELEDRLKIGDDLDGSLVSLETAYKAGGPISEAETTANITKVKEDSEALANLLKATSKHMQSLNATVKLK